MNRLLLGKDIKEIVNNIVFGYITELNYEDGYYIERCLKDYEESIISGLEDHIYELENEVSDLENEVERLEGLLEDNEIEY